MSAASRTSEACAPGPGMSWPRTRQRRWAVRSPVMARTRIVFGHVENEKGVAAPAPAGDAATLAPWMTRRAPPEHVLPRLIRPSDALPMHEPPAFSPLRQTHDPFKRGNVVHALLSRLPEIAPDARKALAVKYAIAQGFPEDEATTLAEETLRVLNDPDFAPAFSPASRAEVAFLAESAGIGTGGAGQWPSGPAGGDR